MTANLRWSPGDRIGSAYSAQATPSQERNREADPTLDSRGALVRIGWEASPAPGLEAHAALLVQRSRFGAFDPALGARREDRYAELGIGIAGDLAAGVQWRLDCAVARYRSTVVAFGNDWRSAAFSIAWRF